MKFGVLMFLLISAAISSQAAQNCFQKYVQCLPPMINEWGKMDNCSLVVPFMECVTDVTKECLPGYVAYFENYQSLILDVCDPDVSKNEEWKKARECVIKNANSFGECAVVAEHGGCKGASDSIMCVTSTMNHTCGEWAGDVARKVLFPLAQLAESCQTVEKAEECLLNNAESFLSCKVKGEFNTVGDICGSVDGFITCFVQKVKQVCGNETQELVQLYTDWIAFAMDICKKTELISEIVVPECDRKVLKCAVDLRNVDELKCMDVSTYVRCLAGAAKVCEGDKRPLYLIALEKYSLKLPVYCNKDSTFRKNLEQKYACINSTFGEVTGPCYKRLEKDEEKASKDDEVRNLRASVNFLDCLSKDFGKKCGNEAESAVNDLLNPLAQSMDESCRLLTGKNCNGATGLMTATWLLIASVVFLLTRKNE